MTPSALLLEEPVATTATATSNTPGIGFRLRSIMRQGTAASIPETWTRFESIDDARLAVKHMYHDDRVLKIFIVTDEAPARFVEWVDR
ncbi:MAG TPA: hypothetical protein VH583_25225 [Vicinamibacterales bacterium]|jgi:hypothetical protein